MTWGRVSCVTEMASFPCNLRDWLPSDSRDRRRGTQVGILRLSIHCLIGMHPLVSCRPLVVKDQASANQRSHHHSVWYHRGCMWQANQRPSHSRVQKVLSSATRDPYKLRCVSVSGSVLEYLWLWTLQADAVGGTLTALTLRFTGKEASSRS